MSVESERRVELRRKKDLQGSLLQHGIMLLVVAVASSIGAFVWGQVTKIAQVPEQIEALRGLPGQLRDMQTNFQDIRSEAAAAVSRNIAKDREFEKRDQDLQNLIEEQRAAYTQILKDHAAFRALRK